MVGPIIKLMESDPNIAAVQPKIWPKDSADILNMQALPVVLWIPWDTLLRGRLLNKPKEIPVSMTPLFPSSGLGAAFVVRSDLFKSVGDLIRIISRTRKRLIWPGDFI
jgi:GT2 family glycosyltransferase